MIVHPGALTRLRNATILTPMPAVTFRLPDDLHAALRERAQLDARSMNRELEFLLRQALFPPVEADAYRDRRRTLAALPRHQAPEPTTRPPRA